MAVNRSPTRSFSGMGQVQQETEEKLRRLERKANALKLAMTPDPLARSPYETAAYEHVQKLKEDVMRALIRSGKSRASSKGTSASVSCLCMPFPRPILLPNLSVRPNTS